MKHEVSPTPYLLLPSCLAKPLRSLTLPLNLPPRVTDRSIPPPPARPPLSILHPVLQRQHHPIHPVHPIHLALPLTDQDPHALHRPRETGGEAGQNTGGQRGLEKGREVFGLGEEVGSADGVCARQVGGRCGEGWGAGRGGEGEGDGQGCFDYR